MWPVSPVAKPRRMKLPARLTNVSVSGGVDTQNNLPWWRNWHTRMVQGHVGEIPWEFDSPSRHK